VPSPEAETAEPTDQTIRKHSVTISGHRTSLSLEQAFWDALKGQARAEGLSVAALIERIDHARSGNLSSAVRVYLLGRAANQGRKSG
jgi:predicted DNA-binding ribbon-helix-helix protein